MTQMLPNGFYLFTFIVGQAIIQFNNISAKRIVLHFMAQNQTEKCLIQMFYTQKCINNKNQIMGTSTSTIQ